MREQKTGGFLNACALINHTLHGIQSSAGKQKRILQINMGVDIQIFAKHQIKGKTLRNGYLNLMKNVICTCGSYEDIK